MNKFWNKEMWAVLWLLMGLGFLGMAFGAIFANIAYPYRGSEAQVLGVYVIEQLKNKKISDRDFLCYLLEERYKSFLVFALGGMTSLARPMSVCVMLCMGFLAGAMGSMTVLQYGMRGLGIFFAANMPQALLLVPSMLYLITGIYYNNGKIWRRPVNVIKLYLRIVIISALGEFAGVLLECFVNPFLLSKIFT